jgi:hypothetical protein
MNSSNSKSPDLTRPSLNEAPIVNLLMTSPHDMSDEELDALIDSSRKLATSAQSRTAAVKGTTAPKKAKLDLGQFL